ncbi:hypothetical protein [Absidia glauca]|uniref:RRM domain-containing protein n=1 Tax=Absidia glauca TaxID=4829 RepID=A0A163JMB4_ABSGL|nr:hypothetical protein [Absidia glauca]
MSKSINTASIANITPTRAFFRASRPIPTQTHARQLFKTLGQYGDMVEYRMMRCPESHTLLRFGFVVYKHQEDAKRAFNDQFIKVESDLFDKPCELKIEASKPK